MGRLQLHRYKNIQEYILVSGGIVEETEGRLYAAVEHGGTGGSSEDIDQCSCVPHHTPHVEVHEPPATHQIAFMHMAIV